MKTVIVSITALSLFAGMMSFSARGQSSVPSLAEYKKKQDDGIAEAVRQSQGRAQAGRLGLLKAGKGEQPGRSRPAVIRVGVHPRQTGIDNRHGMNVR